MEVIVPGKPIGKGRPRFSTAGGYPRTFTPAKTVEFENLVRLAWMQAGGQKMDGSLMATIRAVFAVPKSYSKKKREALLGRGYDHKPDCDNIAKAVLDALNGIAYDDDAQVTDIVVQKVYGEDECTEISITERI